MDQKSKTVTPASLPDHVAMRHIFIPSSWAVVAHNFNTITREAETGLLCVTALAVLNLALVEKSDLRLTEIHLPLPPE